jgi:chlorobactene glucosyltransferase
MSTDFIFTVISYAASIAVWIRFKIYFKRYHKQSSDCVKPFPKISIIIPVRNEEANISQMLASILKTKNAAHEIIVVDDQSSDSTKLLAAAFPVTVLSAGLKPSSWAGKSWACHIGAQHATGELLLFTDADTLHYSFTLTQAYQFMADERADMISVPAFYLNRNWWEKLLGPFHCFMHAGASPYDKPKKHMAFAIGQFLMIRRETYQVIGGHSLVKDALAEDVALANLVLEAGAKYRMYNGWPICSVQMYRSFSDFISGWTRLMRSGMNTLSMEIVFRSLVPLFSLNIIHLFQLTWFAWIPALSTLICFAFVQNRIGRFSLAGIILFPLSVVLFIAIGMTAMISEWLKLPISWRGRSYQMANQRR